MKRQTVYGVAIALFITSFSTLEFGIKPVQASSGTILQVDPTTSIADFGESFTVNIDIQDVTDLSSYDVKFGFNWHVLEATNVEEGPFLKEGTISPLGTDFIKAIVNSESEGSVRVMCNIIGDYPGVDGSGTLFNVTFTVRPSGGANVGFSDLRIYHYILLDSTSTGIPHSVKHGSFSTALNCVRIEPSSIVDPTLSPGKTFTVDVMISRVLFLYAWQVNMSFNPEVLRFVNVAEGDFLKSQPAGTIGVKHIEESWAVFGWTTMGEYLGKSGSGTLATVEFEVLKIGESLLEIETDPFYIELTDTWVYPTFLMLQGSPNPPPDWTFLYPPEDLTVQNGYFNNFGAVVASASLDIDPDTLNLKSKGRWVASYIELPEGYDVSDIDISTVMLNGIIGAELHPIEIGDYDSDGISDLMIKFDRHDLIATLSKGEVTLTITGEVDGTSFEGSDSIRVI
ncbi:MAG: cohesin domain-containing protein [Candidatus Bathyarchaeota archaeon]|nr:cohesin domain-containing protein [Candidatus Bathyarchaeota archaeon]